jgi:hypothetical protein
MANATAAMTMFGRVQRATSVVRDLLAAVREVAEWRRERGEFAARQRFPELRSGAARARAAR